MSEELDHLGERRLSARAAWVWYLVAAVTYVAAGIWQKGLLNWFVGPAWLVSVVVFGPAAWDRITRRAQR